MDKVIYNNHLSMVVAHIDDQLVVIGFCDGKQLNNFFRVHGPVSQEKELVSWMNDKFTELVKEVPHYWRYAE